MTKRLLIGLAALAVLPLAGSAIAVATSSPELATNDRQQSENDAREQVGGTQAERAERAALEATRGGRANAVERDGENGATWEVEVTRQDGDTVDVRLDENLDVVVIEGDPRARTAEAGSGEKPDRSVGRP